MTHDGSTPSSSDAATIDHGRTFTSLDPRDESVLGRYPIMDAADVATTVDRARTSARWCGQLGLRGRRELLLEFKKVIATESDSLVSVISAETGKPHDAGFFEVMLTVEYLDWAARNAQKVLRPRRVPSAVPSMNQKAIVEYLPLRVVGVIGSWNFPAFTPMGSISFALAAGNAVVFKPSELTPGVGTWFEKTWVSVVPGHPVLQVVTGFERPARPLRDPVSTRSRSPVPVPRRAK